jgi:predicted RNase H-like HicB family nuclease
MIVYANRFDEDIEDVAEYPKLKGAFGVGVNEEEAIADLRVNAKAHLEVMREYGMMIPEEEI